jgi:hypothetical protein
MINSHKNVLGIKVFGRDFLSFSFERMKQEAVDAQQPESHGIQEQLTLPETATESHVLVANSLFLHECFVLLTRTEDENLHAVTGSIVGNLRTLDRIVPLQLSLQGLAGAEAENCSLASELIRLNDFGLLPLAYFHSHPGRGANATHPSSTDRQTQSTMEESGSEIIGGIFSRDGFVRFYANKKVPNVHVVGKRIRKVEQNVYKLEIEEDV